ncbi:MAG: phosphate uptake regulator PhoU [Sulfolobales archaeon]|jgi:phosphate uptake regulator
MSNVKSEVRTLQRVGSSLAIYLPKEWCELNKLSKGSKVILRYSDNFLCLELEELSKSVRKELTFDVTSLSEDVLKYLIISLYIIGYDFIKLISRKKISLPLRRYLLSMLRYTSKYEVVEEGENYIVISGVGGTDNVVDALRREFNAVSTVFKYAIEALEGGPKTLDEYYDAMDELDDEVDKTQIEVERAAYKLIERPFINSELIHIIPATIISIYLERLSDHLVLIVRELPRDFPNISKLITYLREFNKNYIALYEVFNKIITKSYSTTEINGILEWLIRIIESKRIMREELTKTFQERGHELITYHVVRIYGLLTDIAEVLVDMLTETFIKSKP